MPCHHCLFTCVFSDIDNVEVDNVHCRRLKCCHLWTTMTSILSQFGFQTAPQITALVRVWNCVFSMFHRVTLVLPSVSLVNVCVTFHKRRYTVLHYIFAMMHIPESRTKKKLALVHALCIIMIILNNARIVTVFLLGWKKLIIGGCCVISHLISSDLKLISASYHDFYCCIFSGKKRSCISGNCYVECKLYIYLLTFDTFCIQNTS